MDTLEILEKEIKRIEERIESRKFDIYVETRLHDALIKCLTLHASIICGVTN